MKTQLIEIEQGDGWAVALIGGKGGQEAAKSFWGKISCAIPGNLYQDKSCLPKKVWCVQALGLTAEALRGLWDEV
jgi:hypothetical protein